MERVSAPDLALAPTRAYATVTSHINRLNRQRVRETTRAMNAAAAKLGRAGWRTRKVVTAGPPLHDLLATIAAVRADLVVVGARGVTGVRHLLLGSVAEGVLNRCPAPVLIVR